MTNPTPPRCEPPEHLRDRDGWHYLGELLDDGEWRPVLARWFVQRSAGMWHFSGIGRPSTVFEPPALVRLGYRYLMPVPSPAEIEALRKALEFYRDQWIGDMEGDGETPGLSRCFQRPTDELLDDGGRKAHAALRPFLPQETKDG